MDFIFFHSPTGPSLPQDFIVSAISIPHHGISRRHLLSSLSRLQMILGGPTAIAPSIVVTRLPSRREPSVHYFTAAPKLATGSHVTSLCYLYAFLKKAGSCSSNVEFNLWNGRLRGSVCQCILTRWASARSEECSKRER
ncbi:hypothetical protein Bca101_041788 [Brassica carinata]